MKNFLKINWNELRELGKKTHNTSILFEEGRSKYLEIIQSLNECWEGQDSVNFINNATNYLNILEDDSRYLSELAKYYNISAGTYNESIDAHSEKIKRNRELREAEEKRGSV